MKQEELCRKHHELITNTMLTETVSSMGGGSELKKYRGLAGQLWKLACTGNAPWGKSLHEIDADPPALVKRGSGCSKVTVHGNKPPGNCRPLQHGLEYLQHVDTSITT